MKKLNLNQRKAISDFFVNLSVALISIGVINQLISDKRLNLISLIIIISSIVISGFISMVSLFILK